MTDNKVRHFTDLEVWRRSHALFLEVFRDLDKLPRSRATAALTDQIVRSLGSVGANLAEGFNRSKAKYLASLDVALGEANEAENWLYKLRDTGHLAPNAPRPTSATASKSKKSARRPHPLHPLPPRPPITQNLTPNTQHLTPRT